VVLAAAVHDYGHPGTNNAYAVKTGQLYAKIYNDQAVYENSALYQALTLTDNPELDYAARFSEDTKRLLRVTVIDLVLSTDMSRHFDMVTMVKSKVGSAVAKPSSRQSISLFESLPNRLANRRDGEAYIQNAVGVDLQDISPDQMHLIFQFALKVADIGHCMLPLDQHKFWVGNLETEFFNQGDLEKEAGVSISPLMDRNKPGPSNGNNQAGFFEVIVLPTISLWQLLFPGSADQLHRQTESNLRFWKVTAHPERNNEDEVPTNRHRSFSTVTRNAPTVLPVRSTSGRFNGRHTLDSVDYDTMTSLQPSVPVQRSLTASREDVDSESASFPESRRSTILSFKSLSSHHNAK